MKSLIVNCFLSCFLLFVFCFLLFPKHVSAQTPSPEAVDCRADSMQYYVQTYGFYERNNSGYKYTSPLNPNQKENFEKAKSLAIKYAPFSDIDPVLVVWWIYFETGQGKTDSYSWNNCLDRIYDVNFNCPDVSSGKWQLGYGQQFATYPRLPAAFTDIYGNPNDVAKTKAVGQNVLNSAKQSKTFPDKSVSTLLNEFINGDEDAKYWLSVLMRDPDISSYLTASAISGDINNANKLGKNFRDYTFQWASYYKTSWQEASNLLNDVLLAWNATSANEETLKQCSALIPSTKRSSQPINPSTSGTKEEVAVYNISNANLPPEIVNEPVKDEEGIRGFFEGIIEKFTTSFWDPPIRKPKYYSQSERVISGDIPNQVIPKEGNFFENLVGFVSKNTGFFGNYLPPQYVSDNDVLGVNLTTNPQTSTKLNTIKDYEQAFETTHFPDGISPVTGSRVSSSPTTGTPTSSTPSTPGQFNTALEEQMIKMVNEERAKAGVRPLTFDPTLLPLTRDIAKDIPNLVDKPELFYAHINSRGEDLAKRAERLGITYRPIYENLSHSHQDVNKSMQGLLSSKGHKDNMLQPELTKIAIGVYQGENVVYVAQVFR